jgi:hypothetical protein
MGNCPEALKKTPAAKIAVPGGETGRFTLAAAWARGAKSHRQNQSSKD